MNGEEQFALRSASSPRFSTQENECQSHYHSGLETGGPSNANTEYSLCFCLAEEQQQLAHSNQAESHTAVDHGAAQQNQQQQKQDYGDPGLNYCHFQPNNCHHHFGGDRLYFSILLYGC